VLNEGIFVAMLQQSVAQYSKSGIFESQDIVQRTSSKSVDFFVDVNRRVTKKVDYNLHNQNYVQTLVQNVMYGSFLVHTLIDANFRASFVGRGPSLEKNGKEVLVIKLCRGCVSKFQKTVCSRDGPTGCQPN